MLKIISTIGEIMAGMAVLVVMLILSAVPLAVSVLMVLWFLGVI